MATAHVLIVDDDPDTAEALAGLLHLRLADIEIDRTTSPSSALRLIGQANYDAVISDIQMPELDGFALLKKVRERKPDTPVILITGHGDSRSRVAARDAGAFAFVEKPLDRDRFVTWVKRAIGKKN